MLRVLEGPSGRTDSCLSSPSLTFQENPSYKGDVAEPKAAPTVSCLAASLAEKLLPEIMPSLRLCLKAGKCPKTEPAAGTVPVPCRRVLLGAEAAAGGCPAAQQSIPAPCTVE